MSDFVFGLFSYIILMNCEVFRSFSLHYGCRPSKNVSKSFTIEDTQQISGVLALQVQSGTPLWRVKFEIIINNYFKTLDLLCTFRTWGDWIPSHSAILP